MSHIVNASWWNVDKVVIQFSRLIVGPCKQIRAAIELQRAYLVRIYEPIEIRYQVHTEDFILRLVIVSKLSFNLAVFIRLETKSCRISLRKLMVTYDRT